MLRAILCCSVLRAILLQVYYRFYYIVPLFYTIFAAFSSKVAPVLLSFRTFFSSFGQVHNPGQGRADENHPGQFISKNLSFLVRNGLILTEKWLDFD